MRIVFTAEAMQDMDELTEYIRSLPKAPAIALGQALQQTIRRIAVYPELGPLDPELSAVAQHPVHRRLCGEYVFFYIVRDRQTEIIAVLHGRRNLMRIVTVRADRR